MELLKKLCEAHGVPGREEAVRALVVSELKGLCDEIRTDALGNVIALKKGNGRGPKVMIAAHMDEIGFLVSHVDEKNGFVRIDPVGGFDPRVLMAQRVLVHTESGDLMGIIGSKPPHILTEEERKKPLELKDLFIDLGLPAEEVKKRVNLGDFVTLHQDFIEVGNLVSCKALDDRVGVYVMIEAVKKVKKHVCDIYAVATTQEEVGVRGARVSSFNVAPDIGVALDVTVASDVPGVGEHEHVTKLGAGVAIKIKDSLSISNPKLVRTMREIAEKKKIKYQLEILPRGGTDAGAIQMTREGVAAITFSIPTRYLHSVVEAAHKDDIQAAVDLLAAFLEIAHDVDYSL
jgi:endoglucanase